MAVVDSDQLYGSRRDNNAEGNAGSMHFENWNMLVSIFRTTKIYSKKGEMLLVDHHSQWYRI
jgi:hypothetical protein